MNDSPWSAYGRMPALPSNNDAAAAADNPVAGVVNEVLRGQAKLEQYLNGVMREYFEIHSGDTGYRSIIDDAMTPSNRPETIEERLKRFAREAESRRPPQRTGRPRTR
jgi:hypothetical protein